MGICGGIMGICGGIVGICGGIVGICEGIMGICGGIRGGGALGVTPCEKAEGRDPARMASCSSCCACITFSIKPNISMPMPLLSPLFK